MDYMRYSNSNSVQTEMTKDMVEQGRWRDISVDVQFVPTKDVSCHGRWDMDGGLKVEVSDFLRDAPKGTAKELLRVAVATANGEAFRQGMLGPQTWSHIGSEMFGMSKIGVFAERNGLAPYNEDDGVMYDNLRKAVREARMDLGGMPDIFYTEDEAEDFRAWATPTFPAYVIPRRVAFKGGDVLTDLLVFLHGMAYINKDKDWLKVHHVLKGMALRKSWASSRATLMDGMMVRIIIIREDL